MRIAYFLADHGIPVFGSKGASVHVRSLCQAWSDLGHEVVLFCTKRGNEPPDCAYEVCKIATPAPETVTVDENDPLAHRRLKEQRYLESAETMARTFARRHAQTPFDAIYERYSLWSAAGVRAAREAGLPGIIEVNAPLLLEQRRYRQLALDEQAEAVERENFANASAIVTVSRAVARYVTAQGGHAEKIQVLPNGVDPERFHRDITPAPLPEAEGRTVIAFAGSLKAWHGVEILLDAFRELNRRVTGAHLLIIGDGPLRQWIEGYIHGAALADRVTLTGWRDHDEVASLLAAADIAVAPYPELEDFYFSPLKLFEYLAMGKAIVASRIGQIEDLLDAGEHALLTPPGDTLALADALERLVVDESLRRQLGHAAAMLGDRFTWQANAEAVAQTMKRLAAGGVAAS